MKKHKKLLLLVISVVFGLLIINCIKEKNDYFSSSFALACVGQKYDKVSDNAYLTFELSEKNN